MRLRREPEPPPITDVPDGDRVIVVTPSAGQTLIKEKARRRDVLGRLRELVKDARAVENLIVDDYARADQERRG